MEKNDRTSGTDLTISVEAVEKLKVLSAGADVIFRKGVDDLAASMDDFDTDAAGRATEYLEGLLDEHRPGEQ